jgi:hypothetical protein
MNVSALNMQRVVQARDHHNATCSLGAATEVHLNAGDVARCGWEDGDMLAGLRVVGDADRAPGTLGITCPGDGSGVEDEASVGGEIRTAEPVFV